MTEAQSLENERRLNAIERDILLMRTTMQKELASRDWVNQLIDPIVENTRETRHAVELQARDIQMFIAAHNKAMEDRARQEKEQHEAKMAAIKSENDAKTAALESQTWGNILKNKWAPIAAFLVACAVILSKIAELAVSWLGVHGVPVK